MYTLLKRDVDALTKRGEETSELLCGGMTVLLSSLPNGEKEKLVKKLNHAIESYIQARKEKGLEAKFILAPNKKYMTKHNTGNGNQDIFDMLLSMESTLEVECASVEEMSAEQKDDIPTVGKPTVSKVDQTHNIAIDTYSDEIDYSSSRTREQEAEDEIFNSIQAEEEQDENIAYIGDMAGDDEEDVKYDGSTSSV